MLLAQVLSENPGIVEEGDKALVESVCSEEATTGHQRIFLLKTT